jgi:hypothetical protein
MAAAELTRLKHRWRLPAELRPAWLRAYAGIWAVTLGSAVLVALAGERDRTRLRRLLRLRLQSAGNAPPHIGHILALAAHNIPIAAWPVLLGVIGTHHHRLARRIADSTVLACITVNSLPGGAALGAYGAPLLAFIPQLPIEWAGLALGASAWLVQRRRPLTALEGLMLTVLTAAVLVCAAVVETVAVPHR